MQVFVPGRRVHHSLVKGNAAGAEWRAWPLWGTGLTAGVSLGETCLHDGRVRKLNEAIMWHGSEEKISKQAFSGMSDSEKNAIIVFLKIL